MDAAKCAPLMLLLTILASSELPAGHAYGASEEASAFDRGYRTVSRIYEECQHRDFGVCLKKKAIVFLERLGRIDSLPIADNVELVRSNDPVENALDEDRASSSETSGRTGGTKDETLNDVLFDRLTSLLNGFDVQIRLPRTSSSELKRSLEEGRGKMKKMMGMMMMGVAMKMAAMIPLAMGVLFLLAGKALIVSKIALVLSLIIGLKKLLAQKQGGGGAHEVHHGGWQQGGGGGWDRSMRSLDLAEPVAETERSGYAQSLAYGAGSGAEAART